MYKVSVIVPVYNVEQYLDACLDSIDAQTYKDFELILVDDGSPDKCGEMCDAYAKEHPNTKVIHQENMGLSEARNQGVKIAEGEYVTFIDSDDYIAPDYVEYLLQLMEKYEADVAIANNVKFFDGQTPIITQRAEMDVSATPGQALSKMCYGEYSICAWGKMYKRFLVEKYPYPKGALYEDLATTYKIVGDSKKIAYGNKVVYYWRQRAGSITRENITERHFFGITATKQMLEYIEQNYPEAIPAAENRCATKIIDNAYRIVMSNKDKVMFRRTRAEIKPFVGSILKNKRSSFAVKLRTATLWLGYTPFLLISKVYSKLK